MYFNGLTYVSPKWEGYVVLYQLLLSCDFLMFLVKNIKIKAEKVKARSVAAQGSIC